MATNTAQFPEFDGFEITAEPSGGTFTVLIRTVAKTVDGPLLNTINESGVAPEDFLVVARDGYTAHKDAVEAAGYTLPVISETVLSPIEDPQPGLPMSAP